VTRIRRQSGVTNRRRRLLPAPPGAVRVFGSVARGDSSADSDVDFLVHLDEQRVLSDLGGLLMDLQDLLGCDVDVTTEAGLRPRVAERVLADAVDL
jgi:predicted nucleotidyltransferase